MQDYSYCIAYVSCYEAITVRMWDMSALIRRCENFGLLHSLCSELVEKKASERQTTA